VQNHTHGETEKFIDRAHPFRVARGEIIIHRHNVDAATGERIQINRHGADERFAFAGGHFRNVSGMQRVAADELHVERHHFPANGMFADNHVLSAQAPAGVFDHGERLRQNLLQLAGQFGSVLN